MTKVHLVTEADAVPVTIERTDGAIPFLPLRAVYVRFRAPTIEQSDFPWEDESLALHPELAKELAREIWAAAVELEKKPRRR